jgi:uncharacterized protein
MLFNQAIQEIYTHYYLVRNTHSIGQLLFFFFLFSLLGWGLETIYRTIRNRRLINPGFLTGPIVPLYGVSGVFILITYLHAHHYSIVTRIVLYFLAITILEYITGETMLRFFKKRFWDYRDEILNFRGHVCVPFSLAWAALSILFEQIIYPFSVGILLTIPGQFIWICNGISLLVILLDFVYSSGLLVRLMALSHKRIRKPKFVKVSIFPLHSISAAFSGGQIRMFYSNRLQPLVPKIRNSKR